MIIPSPGGGGGGGMAMHASPSPAASSSSYIPPSPPVSLGLSPHMEASYHAHSPRSSSSHKQQHASGCGLCASSSSVNCICQDIGLRNVQDQETVHAHEHPHRYVGRAHEEDEEMPNLDDLGLIPSASSRIPSEMDRCGFCTESTSGACLCAEAGMRRTYKPQSRSAIIGSSSKRAEEAGEHEDTLTPLRPSRIAIPRTQSSPSSSTSKNLVTTGNSIPPGSTSVRLRLPKRGIAAGQIWRIDTSLATAAAQQQLQQQQQASSVPVQSKVQEQLTHTVPVAQRNPAAAAGVALRRKLIKVGSRLPCSGDPKTCLACADDP